MCSIEVRMNESVKSLSKEVAREVLSWCSSRYGFDEVSGLEELMRDMNISIVSKEKKEKKEKVVKAEVVKASFPLPFNGVHDENVCQALRQNQGLYTQCVSARKEGGLFCKSCQGLADKSGVGIPEYGTIEQRMAVPILEYVDPKGRKVRAYSKVMKKYNLSREQVIAEATKMGMSIMDVHFEAAVDSKRGRPATKPKEAKEAKGAKGRPKKAIKVLQLEDEEEDLFANLVAEANADEEVSVVSDISTATSKEDDKKAAKEQEKAAKEAAKEAEKAAKEQEKAAKEQAKAAEKAAKEAEKAAKEAAKEAEKAAKEAAKEAEKAAKEQAKAAEKAAKEAAKKETKKETKKEEDNDQEETTLKITKDSNGNKYLKSPKTNIVYEYAAYVEDEELIKVGMWNSDKKEIIFSKEDSDSELEEDEVDEE